LGGVPVIKDTFIGFQRYLYEEPGSTRAGMLIVVSRADRQGLQPYPYTHPKFHPGVAVRLGAGSRQFNRLRALTAPVRAAG
jgi:hypothetical protein